MSQNGSNISGCVATIIVCRISYTINPIRVRTVRLRMNNQYISSTGRGGSRLKAEPPRKTSSAIFTDANEIELGKEANQVGFRHRTRGSGSNGTEAAFQLASSTIAGLQSDRGFPWAVNCSERV